MRVANLVCGECRRYVTRGAAECPACGGEPIDTEMLALVERAAYLVAISAVCTSLFARWRELIDSMHEVFGDALTEEGTRLSFRLELGPEDAPRYRTAVCSLVRALRELTFDLEKLYERESLWDPGTDADKRDAARAVDGLLDLAGGVLLPLVELESWIDEQAFRSPTD